MNVVKLTANVPWIMCVAYKYTLAVCRFNQTRGIISTKNFLTLFKEIKLKENENISNYFKLTTHVYFSFSWFRTVAFGKTILNFSSVQ